MAQLELRVLVVEEVRGGVEVDDRSLGVGLQTDLRQADAHVPGKGRQRLADVGCARVLVRVYVGMLVGDAIEQPVGLGVVRVGAGVVGVDARQIVLGHELVLGRGELERRDRDLVVAAVVGADALLQGLLRRAERRRARDRECRRKRKQHNA